MPGQPTVSVERLERATRIYKTAKEAAAAVGMAAGCSIIRACDRYGVEVPQGWRANRKK